MAGKAKLLATVIEKALTSDEESEADSTLREQMQAFKSILIYEIEPRQFADIYAQTIAYGMMKPWTLLPGKKPPNLYRKAIRFCVNYFNTLPVMIWMTGSSG